MYIQGTIHEPSSLELQQSGGISGDFTFVQASSFTPNLYEGNPGFYHQFIEGVSSVDNVILTLDPWRGTITSRPINSNSNSNSNSKSK